jgi:hydroxymethylglutaryl-CoA lyase
MAIANIYASLELGMAVFDSSIAGLGGCPYAPAPAATWPPKMSSFLLQGLAIECGVDMDKLLAAGQFISQSPGPRTGVESGARAARQAGWPDEQGL